MNVVALNIERERKKDTNFNRDTNVGPWSATEAVSCSRDLSVLRFLDFFAVRNLCYKT